VDQGEQIIGTKAKLIPKMGIVENNSTKVGVFFSAENRGHKDRLMST
jgi:hypothetical protein